jgi:hypothetical protein
MITMVAIDPGVGGGIAYEDGENVYAVPMPSTLGDMAALIRILAADGPTFWVEELPKFAGRMSASSMGVMFRNYGRLEGLITAAQCRIEYIPPKKWQKILGLGDKATHGDRWKAHLKGRAQALFPRLDVTLKTADALLILEAARKLTI